MLKHNYFKYVLVALILLSACDSFTEPSEEGEPVVEAYLIANELLPTIRLTRTTDINNGFNFPARAIRDANVQLVLKGLDQAPDVIVDYVQSDTMGGLYEPLSPDLVLPGRTYHFKAVISSTSEEISATTIVPTDLNILRIAADTVKYLGDVQYAVDLTRSRSPGRNAIFVQSIAALEPDTCELTPFYLWDIYDLDETDEYDCTQLEPGRMIDYLLVASPPLNEEGYETNPDESVNVSLPWFAVVFYGQSRVGTAAVDDSIYDFMRFQAVQQAGGTLSPGEIPNVLDHVDGGRGVFGSMARVESIMTVVR